MLQSISREKFKSMFSDYMMKYSNDLVLIRTDMEIKASNIEGSSQRLHNVMLNALSSIDYALSYVSGIITYDSIRDDRMLSKSYSKVLKTRTKK